MAFWSFTVSLVIAELLQSGLLTQMTLQRKTWPTNFAEIYDQRHHFDFICTNCYYFVDIENRELLEIAYHAKKVTITDPINIAKLVKNGTTIMFAESVEVATFEGLINPDKFAYLDERHLWSQDVFLVRKNFKHRNTVLKV